MSPAGLVHRLREPEGAPAGALILNHGRGADENDLYPLLDELDPERLLLGVTTGAPLIHGASTAAHLDSASLRLTDVPPGGRHWYLVPRVGYPDARTFADSYALLGGFLDELLAEREIAWDRVAIGGFSMGAVMSYAVALGPARPAPAVLLAFSGFIPNVAGWSAELAGRDSLSVFVHHGRNDPVIPVQFGRTAHELLDAHGIEHEYVETDAGHAIPPDALDQASRFVARYVEGLRLKPRR